MKAPVIRSSHQGNERIFQYFHIVPIVGEGQQVIAEHTVIGYVQAPFGHVHLTEINGSDAVNPLQKGHLAPYVDHTRPTIRDALIRNQTGLLQTPLGLCGRVEIAVDAFDMPPIRVPGSFGGLPVAPALVRWSITRLNGTATVPWHTAADFRSTLPQQRTRLIGRGILLKYQEITFPPKIFWETPRGECFDSVGQRLISYRTHKKALVFFAAGTKGLS